MAIVTVVPCPGVDTTAWRPPSMLTRSATPARPNPEPIAAARWRARVEPLAVVGNRHHQIRSALGDVDRGARRPRVLDDVVQRFLDDAKDVDFLIRRHRTPSATALRGSVTVNSMFDESPRRSVIASIDVAETQLVQMIRPQVVGDLFDFLDRLRGRGRDLVELGLRRAVARHRPQQRSILDHDQMLAKAVVQFRGDTPAFLLLRIDQLMANRSCAARAASIDATRRR